MERLHTAPTIISLLKKCLYGKSISHIQATSIFDLLINDAIQSQKNIGTTHVRYGSLSKIWSEAQEEYNLRTFPASNFCDLAWASHICLICLRFSMSLWTSRNSCLHDQMNGKLLHVKDLTNDIISMRTSPTSLHTLDSQLLQIPISTILSLPKKGLDLWQKH